VFPLLLCETAKKARPAGHNQLAASAKKTSAERRTGKAKGQTIDNRPYKKAKPNNQNICLPHKNVVYYIVIFQPKKGHKPH